MVSCELVAQAEYILLVAIRRNDIRLDSAYEIVLKAMEICDRFPFLRGTHKKVLLRDILERLVARAAAADAAGEPMFPHLTLVSLRQLVDSQQQGVETLARAVVDITKGRVEINAVYPDDCRRTPNRARKGWAWAKLSRLFCMR